MKCKEKYLLQQKSYINGWVSNDDRILSGQITAVSLLVQNLPPKNLMQREFFVKLIHHIKCQNPVSIS